MIVLVFAPKVGLIVEITGVMLPGDLETAVDKQAVAPDFRTIRGGCGPTSVREAVVHG